MARATPKLLDEDAPEPDAPAEEAPVPGFSIAMARAKAMGEVAVDNGLRFDFSARDASRRSSFSGADNGILAAEPTFSLAAPPLRSSDMRAVSDSIAVVEIEPKHHRMENQDNARSPSRSEYALVAWRTSGLMFSRM